MVEEISGVAFIFNQKFFQDLKRDTGIDLENIVYYKDDTHYFVMTAKKQSLLAKGVIIQVRSGQVSNQEGEPTSIAPYEIDINLNLKICLFFSP